ncbi:MAG TPA: aldo/keto reductase [Acidobacteriota bacterium]|jgi:aryl-alcohol dehydrogenase-like predicted oxidoreductase|nr:aldo/keto reductase [Acidobacteriota bacterium]|tara:strand:- start:6423 stop:7448 length:1026 start_codon:yes stop_codon:yes gene_type:complete
MEYRELGRTGVKVSPLCFGTDNFADPTPEPECVEMLNRALDAGINLLDTGDIYADGEGERIIGRALKKNGRRHSVLISTKIDHVPGLNLDTSSPGINANDHGHSRLNIIRGCEQTLKRLQTDYIDLYQMHRPSPEIPIDETLGALDDLVQQGKIRYIGCSTHPAWMVMEALYVSELKGYARYVSEQSPYNLLDRRIENELIPACQKWGLGIISWAPMAQAVLAGRYKDPNEYPEESRAALRGGYYADRVTERGIAVAQKFAELADQIELTPAQFAVLWCKDQPGITAPLVGPRTLKQLEQLIPLLDIEFPLELRTMCDQLVPPGSAVADFHNTATWMKMKV